MKKFLLTTTILSVLVAAQADPLQFKLSPAGSSPATGLSPANEVPAVTNSTGSGGEVLSGITFDTNTLTLNFAIGYGSALGFTDLTGPATAAHIHGPADVTNFAGVLLDLFPMHLPAGDPAKGGLILGSAVFTPEAASNLLAGLNYINVHTSNNPAGEIRGQLVMVLATNTPATNAAPSLECPAPVVAEVTSPDGAPVDLIATVSDAEGDALTVVWTINGAALQTNSLPAGTNAAQPVPFSATFPAGTNQVELSVSDGTNAAVTCSTTVIVQDTTPPEIRAIVASPNSLWPPNHKMVTVRVRVAASDLGGPVTSRIISVTSNEPENGLGDGDTGPDWQITGALGLKLRAERSGKGSGRIYTINIEAADEAGNASTGQVTVTVPHDKGGGNGRGSAAKPSPVRGNAGAGNSDDGNSGKDNKGQGNSGRGRGRGN